MLHMIKRAMAFVLAFACLFTCAFAENGNNVVATYNGGEVLLSEIEAALESELNMLLSTMNIYRQMTGGEMYTPTEDDYNKVRETIATAQARFEILLSKMPELGVSDFTEEEKASLKKEAENYYLENIYAYMQQGISMEDAAYYLATQGLTVEMLYDNFYRSAIQEKVTAALEIDETVTDEDIQAKYEQLTSNYEKNYAKAPTQVETSANSGNTVYFMPENMRYVKHIVIISENEALVSEYNTAIQKLMAYESEYATVTAATYQPKYDAIVEKAIKEECLENIDIWEAKVEDLKERYLESVRDEIDQILSAIENGESFDHLIETYSDDPGSKVEPVKSNGYLVYENSAIWDEAFIEAAKALDNVGDVSEPAVGTLGVYIVKYESQPQSGKAGLDDVKEAVIQSVLSERRSNNFASLAEAWFAEGNIQVNLDAFK